MSHIISDDCRVAVNLKTISGLLILNKPSKELSDAFSYWKDLSKCIKCHIVHLFNYYENPGIPNKEQIIICKDHQSLWEKHLKE